MDLTLSLSRAVWDGFLDEQDVHVRLVRALGAEHDPERRRYLFRADRDVSLGRPCTVSLIQHEGEGPSSDALGALSVETKAEKRISLTSGAMFRFFLRANPTRAEGRHDAPGTTREEWSRGKRRAILDREGRIAWLLRMATRSGFQLREFVFHEGGRSPDVRAVSSGTIRLRGKGGPNALVVGVDIEGSLVVEEPTQFAMAVLRGIGTGKAWGFGLLSLAPIQP